MKVSLLKSGKAAYVAVTALVIIVLLLMPFIVSSSVMFRIGTAVTAGLLALSFNLLFGTTGLISFAHAALFAIGGYGIGIALQAGVTWPVALVFATLLGGAVGLLFSGVAVRATGIYFAVLTLGLGEIVHIILLQWTSVTGGDNGLAGISAGTVLGVDLGDSVTYYWVLVATTAIAVIALRMITFSRFGRTLNAIREDPVRAEFLGIPVRLYRAASFTVSAAFASLAGALFAPLVGLMVPDNAGWAESAEPILSTLLGGVNVFIGPLIGTGVFESIDYFVRDLASLRMIITGILLLLVLLVVPGGIAGTIRDRYRSKRDERRKTRKKTSEGVAGGAE